MDLEFGIQKQIILGLKPSFASFVSVCLSLSWAEALSPRLATRWHEITRVKSTVVIAKLTHIAWGQKLFQGFPHDPCTTGGGRRFSSPTPFRIFIYLIESLLMIHQMFYVVNLSFVHTDVSESDFGFLCSRLCSVTASASWFTLSQDQGKYFPIKSYF